MNDPISALKQNEEQQLVEQLMKECNQQLEQMNKKRREQIQDMDDEYRKSLDNLHKQIRKGREEQQKEIAMLHSHLNDLSSNIRKIRVKHCFSLHSVKTNGTTASEDFLDCMAPVLDLNDYYYDPSF